MNDLKLKYTVPTKHHDGGARPTKPHRVGEQDADAFSRYSSDLFRMKTLLLCPEEAELIDDLEAAGKINEIFRNTGLSNLFDINHLGNANNDASSSRVQHGYSRKTRLSFELHPDLLLHDLMEQLDLAESSGAISETNRNPKTKSRTRAARSDEIE